LLTVHVLHGVGLIEGYQLENIFQSLL